jgi:tetratricopeptide (TPR) repeat protein
MSAVARRYYDRGKKALDGGDLDTALESLRAAVELAPGFTTARLAYAVALARCNDGPRAALVARAGLGRATSAIARGALLATLGEILTMTGDFAGAEEALHQASGMPGFEVRAAAGLTRVYARQRRLPEAVAQLKAAAQASAAAGKG